MQPETIRIRTDALEFAALTWGPADGPLALCNHGYPDTAWTWRHLGPYLAERGWRVVAPFARGYAPSDLAPDDCYQVGALAADAIALRDALGGDERAVLIGHDWGGLAATTVAAHAPEHFARIVTLAVAPTAGFVQALASREGVGHAPAQLRRSWYIGFQQLPGLSERRLPTTIRRLWADWSPGYDASEDLRLVAAAMQGPGRRRAVLLYYRALLQPWRWSPRYLSEQLAMLKMPRCPLLYLHGADDGCVGAALAPRSARDLPPQSRFELVEGAGHFLQLERPDVVNPIIADYLGPAA